MHGHFDFLSSFQTLCLNIHMTQQCVFERLEMQGIDSNSTVFCNVSSFPLVVSSEQFLCRASLAFGSCLA